MFESDSSRGTRRISVPIGEKRTSVGTVREKKRGKGRVIAVSLPQVSVHGIFHFGNLRGTKKDSLAVKTKGVE